jgi:hypothetical protein
MVLCRDRFEIEENLHPEPFPRGSISEWQEIGGGPQPIRNDEYRLERQRVVQNPHDDVRAECSEVVLVGAECSEVILTRKRVADRCLPPAFRIVREPNVESLSPLNMLDYIPAMLQRGPDEATYWIHIGI